MNQYLLTVFKYVNEVKLRTIHPDHLAHFTGLYIINYLPGLFLFWVWSGCGGILCGTRS